MSKLAPKDKFLDFSDYGRSAGIFFANALKNTRFTPIHVTLLFGVSGLIAIYCILKNQFLTAGFFIILKSILDAADGELARIKKTPSYTGRYLDSISDFILNFLFIITICYITKASFWLALSAFFCIELQGTLYNYYYVIVRNGCVGGDKTSQIFEYKTPKAFPGESQKWVDILFKIYIIFYGGFDRIIHFMDREACTVNEFPKWYMSIISLYGLGFHLLIIAIMLPLGWTEFVFPFFIIFSVLIPFLVVIRRVFIK